MWVLRIAQLSVFLSSVHLAVLGSGMIEGERGGGGNSMHLQLPCASLTAVTATCVREFACTGSDGREGGGLMARTLLLLFTAMTEVRQVSPKGNTRQS